MKVLHVVGALEGGGIQRFVLNLIRFRGEDAHCDVCVMNDVEGPLAAEARALGASVLTCPLRSAPFQFQKRFGELAAEYDVVHVHRSSSMSGFPLAAARKTGVSVCIAHYHNVRKPSRALRAFADTYGRRLVLKSASSIYAPSEAVLDSHFPHREKTDSRFTVVPSAIDTKQFHSLPDPIEAKRILGLDSKLPVIGHAGRFSLAKNHKFLLRTAAKLPNVQFLLVGDGPLRTKMEALASELKLTNRVVFAGWQEEMKVAYAAMDLFLFPSLWEGMGMVLLEAQAAGVPCVTSSLECFRAILYPELWKHRIQQNTPGEAAGTLAQLLDTGELARLGAGAREYVEQFDIRIIARQIEARYYQLRHT